MSWSRFLLVAAVCGLSTCATPAKAQVRRAAAVEKSAAPVVIVLHGLLQTRVPMDPLCEYLKAGGFQVINFHYPSTRDSLETHAANLQKTIAGLPRDAEIYLVGYSLGNLVIRYYLGNTTDPATGRQADARLRRIVMLAPPNHSPARARLWADHPRLNRLYYNVLDETGHQLAYGWPELEKRLAIPSCEFGIIAGGRGDGRGWHPLLPGDDDGTVTVDEAMLPGARDFVLLPVSHVKIIRNDQAMQCTLRFLKTGCFVSEESRTPLVAAQPTLAR